MTDSNDNNDSSSSYIFPNGKAVSYHTDWSFIKKKLMKNDSMKWNEVD